jgi:hypothetical protein
MNDVEAEYRKCECCGSEDGDPYTIMSNGYCLTCDLDARIACGLPLPESVRLQSPA